MASLAPTRKLAFAGPGNCRGGSELVDIDGSEPSELRLVWVRVPPTAPCDGGSELVDIQD